MGEMHPWCSTDFSGENQEENKYSNDIEQIGSEAHTETARDRQNVEQQVRDKVGPKVSKEKKRKC